MMLFLVLIAAHSGIFASSFVSCLVSIRRIINDPIKIRQMSVKAGATEEPEFFPLGNVNSKSTIDRDTFLFGDKVSFESCGVGSELITALEATGKFHPTAIQAKTFTAIASGRDVIVGAETGSGKTLSYLLPIIQGLLNDGKEEISEEDISFRNYPSAIIMVPNKELCSQVYRMTNDIINNMPVGHNISVGEFIAAVYL